MAEFLSERRGHALAVDIVNLFWTLIFGQFYECYIFRISGSQNYVMSLVTSLNFEDLFGTTLLTIGPGSATASKYRSMESTFQSGKGMGTVVR